MSAWANAGRLESTPFAELAGSLFLEGKSGELSISTEGRTRKIYFLEGSPVAVVSDNPQDHLARFLSEHGKISSEDAQRLEAMPGTKEDLLSADFLPRETLMWGLKYRFVNLCYDCFSWTEGDFEFSEGPPPNDIFLLKVPTPALILKGIDHLPWEFFTHTVPDGAVVSAGPTPLEDASYLPPAEKALVESWQTGGSAGQMLEDSDDPERGRRLLFAFSTLGLLTISAGESIGAEEEPMLEMDSHVYEDEVPLAPEPELDTAPAESLEAPSETFLLEDEEGEAVLEDEAPALEPPSLDEPQEETLLFDGDEEETPPSFSDSGSDDMGGDVPPAPWQEELPLDDDDESQTMEDLKESLGGTSDMFSISTEETGGEEEEEPPKAEKKGGRKSRLSFPQSRLAKLLLAVAGLVVLSGGIWGGMQYFLADKEPTASGPVVPAPKPPPPPPSITPPSPPVPTPTATPADPAGPPQGISPPPASEPAEPAAAIAPPPAAAPEPDEPTKPVAPVSEPVAATSAPAPAPPPPPEPAPVSTPEPVTAKPAPPVPAAPFRPTVKAFSGDTRVDYEIGLGAFRAGDISGAAESWQDMLRKAPAGVYTIQVEAACEEKTVLNDFDRYGENINMFLVPVTIGERSCYRICQGLYPSKKSASAALARWPAEIRAQGVRVKSARELAGK